jgi:hypothetical protein
MDKHTDTHVGWTQHSVFRVFEGVMEVHKEMFVDVVTMTK